MPHHRTSSLFSAAAGGATAGTRRSATAAAVSLASVAVLALAAPVASAAPIPLPHHWSGDGLVGAGHHAVGHRTPVDHDLPGDHGPAADLAAGDHLTVTVHRSGSARTDGTFELFCHPGGGNHLHVKGACARLDGMTRWGRDPFAPVPQGTNCTMMYGGPATAHVSGTWAGRPVNADFRRTNGCEISRWGRFEPLLPSPRS
jgi:hypothetical protein